MFNIDIPSWLIPDLAQGFFIVVGFILGAILTLILQRRQWAKEQALKDMGIIYEPLLDEISKLIECKNLKRTFNGSRYFQYVDDYKRMRRLGKVNPEPHRELKGDMDDLVGRMDAEHQACNVLKEKLRKSCVKIFDDIEVILKDGSKKTLSSYLLKIMDCTPSLYDSIICGTEQAKQKWTLEFDKKMEEIESYPEVDKILMELFTPELFDRLSSDIKREREDFFSKEGKIFDKAEDIKKKLDYKTEHPLKRYGEYTKEESHLQFFIISRKNIWAYRKLILICGLVFGIPLTIALMIEIYFIELFPIKALLLAPIYEEALKFLAPFLLTYTFAQFYALYMKLRKKEIQVNKNINKILLLIFLGSFFLCTIIYFAGEEIIVQNVSFHNGDAFRKYLSHLMYTIPFITMFFFFHERFYYGWAMSSIYHSINNMICVFKGNLFFPTEPFTAYLQWAWIISISFSNIILVLFLFERNRTTSE